jgi:hypothetical protein
LNSKPGDLAICFCKYFVISRQDLLSLEGYICGVSLSSLDHVFWAGRVDNQWSIQESNGWRSASLCHSRLEFYLHAVGRK